jgi:hypothetical protein
MNGYNETNPEYRISPSPTATATNEIFPSIMIRLTFDIEIKPRCSIN